MKPVSPIVPGMDLKEVIYGASQPDKYQPLPVFRDEDGKTLSRWHMTWRERLRVLWAGDVYLVISTFKGPLQPVRLSVEPPVEIR